MRRQNSVVLAANPFPPSVLQSLFEPLLAYRSLGVAVSGGVDSLALLFLLHTWRQAVPNAPHFHVLTVDHGLRKEAKDEVAFVAKVAQELGFPCDILTLSPFDASHNLAAQARNGRYRALIQVAHRLSLQGVLTAHHQDDQAETVLMRLLRGSGAYGLAGIHRRQVLAGLDFLRPLLAVSKMDLARVVDLSGYQAVHDSSNYSPRLQRNRLRQLMPQLAAEGLTAERLYKTAQRMQRLAEAIDWQVDKVLTSAASFQRFGDVVVDRNAVVSLPDEIGLRLFSRLLMQVGGAFYPPRHDRLERLWQALKKSNDGQWTLNHVVIHAQQGRFILLREVGRNGLATVAVTNSSPVVWDQRFVCEILLAHSSPSQTASVPCEPAMIGALPADHLRVLEEDYHLRLSAIERQQLLTTPAFFKQGEIVDTFFSQVLGAPPNLVRFRVCGADAVWVKPSSEN